MGTKSDRKSDRHASGFMVRLPEAYREPLKKLAKRNRRTMTAEVLIALEKHLAEQGLWSAESEE